MYVEITWACAAKKITTLEKVPPSSQLMGLTNTRYLWGGLHSAALCKSCVGAEKQITRVWGTSAFHTENILSHSDSAGWAAHPTIFSVVCNSDCEIQAALYTVETVVRAQRHCNDADKVSMLSVG